tara:strand:+ start:3165 stop:3878 length:714 start_codon:yes stop_codon:yes gene_type:complete
MCDLTLAMMGIQAAQGVASISAQQQQAEAQAAAQDAASVREMQRQQMAMRSERMQQSQEETSMAQEALKAQRESEASISTGTVAAESVNVAGTSVGLGLQDLERSNADYQSALALQARLNDASRRLGLANAGEQYVTNMIGINQPIAQPDYLGTILGTAGSMIGTYQQGQLYDMQTENANLSRGVMRGQEAAAEKAYRNTQQQTYNLGKQKTAAGIQTGIGSNRLQSFKINRKNTSQ